MTIYTNAKPLGEDEPQEQSEQFEQFATGAVRDTQDGKLRYDLIPLTALRRLALVYTEGAEHYEDRNWQKGMPISRVYASLMRHLMAWLEEDRSEDHIAKVVWNAIALLWIESEIRFGDLPDELDDRFNLR